MQLLNFIQQTLKAPKGQFNSFGKYTYRSCEDILTAVKPLLGDGTLTLSDQIILVGDRIYVQATATLNDGTNEVSVSAFARESLSKKGMDDSQVTGTASSYARKYALNGLFAIDDTKDADTTNLPIPDQIASCASMNQLHDLWSKLNKKEQADYKDAFSAAKAKFGE